MATIIETGQTLMKESKEHYKEAVAEISRLLQQYGDQMLSMHTDSSNLVEKSSAVATVD